MKDYGVVTLKEDCSAILEKPKKLGDPSSFTIPISIGNLSIGISFLDLGYSINLIPLSLLNKIRKVARKPTCLMIQLAECSINFPLGIVKNIPVRVGRFTIQVDFVIMDIKEDASIPLILGRPFMNTANVITSVVKGKCTLRMGDEVTFDVHEAMKHPKDKGACFKVDIIDEVIYKKNSTNLNTNTIRACFNQHRARPHSEHNKELEECI